MHKAKAIIGLLLSLLIATQQEAQDRAYALSAIDTLCSPTMWGRGYTHGGLDKAADYIAAEFQRSGIATLTEDSYFQDFHYAVNTFPRHVIVEIDGKEIQPGSEYIMYINSRSGVLKNVPMQQSSADFYSNPHHKVGITLVDKLTWSVGREQEDTIGLILLKSAVEGLSIKDLSLYVDAVFIDSFPARNVCGIVSGTQYPDSFVVISAHYDHLGGMGEDVYFPGANDNASGVALMLDLAQHFALHPLPFSVVFIAFSGEEAGLLGSRYFVQHPLIPLDNIAFVMNLDLMGNGSDGITVVNATEFPGHFARLQDINTQSQYIHTIQPRGRAANSDHFYFSERGIPAFFIYSTGGVPYYHDVHDRPETLPMTIYEPLFHLVDHFLGAISHR